MIKVLREAFSYSSGSLKKDMVVAGALMAVNLLIVVPAFGCVQASFKSRTELVVRSQCQFPINIQLVRNGSVIDNEPGVSPGASTVFVRRFQYKNIKDYELKYTFIGAAIEEEQEAIIDGIRNETIQRRAIEIILARIKEPGLTANHFAELGISWEDANRVFNMYNRWHELEAFSADTEHVMPVKSRAEGQQRLLPLTGRVLVGASFPFASARSIISVDGEDKLREWRNRKGRAAFSGKIAVRPFYNNGAYAMASYGQFARQRFSSTSLNDSFGEPELSIETLRVGGGYIFGDFFYVETGIALPQTELTAQFITAVDGEIERLEVPLEGGSDPQPFVELGLIGGSGNGNPLFKTMMHIGVEFMPLNLSTTNSTFQDALPNRMWAWKFGLIFGWNPI